MNLRAKKLLAWSAAAAVVVAVFALYMQPQVMVTLSELFWACFN
jgi:hypothetical protein